MIGAIFLLGRVSKSRFFAVDPRAALRSFKGILRVFRLSVRIHSPEDDPAGV